MNCIKSDKEDSVKDGTFLSDNKIKLLFLVDNVLSKYTTVNILEIYR